MRTRLPLCLLGFLYLLFTHGCNPEQLRQFARAMNQSGATNSLAPVLRRAVNWTVENFSFTALGAGISIRDSDSGPILGRWFIKRLSFRESQDGNLSAEIAGEGYRHGRYSGVVTFSSAARVLYRADLRSQDADTVIVTFTPLKVFDVSASVIRGGLLAQLGDIFDIPRKRMLDKINRGFTVSFNTRLEKQTYLGLGQPKDLPPKPWIDLGLDEVLLNDRISMCDKSRHFLGPFKVTKGKTLEWRIKADDSRGKVSAYLLADEDVRVIRDAYVDPSRPVGSTYATYASQQDTGSWQKALTFNEDAVAWLLIDAVQVSGELQLDVCVGLNQ